MSDADKQQGSQTPGETSGTPGKQPGEVKPGAPPTEKQPSDAEADGSDRVNSDG